MVTSSTQATSKKHGDISSSPVANSTRKEVSSTTEKTNEVSTSSSIARLIYLHVFVTRKRQWYFLWRNCSHLLWVDSFWMTFDFFPRKFAACSKPPSRGNHRKNLSKDATLWSECGSNPDHVIMVEVKTTLFTLLPIHCLPCESWRAKA